MSHLPAGIFVGNQTYSVKPPLRVRSEEQPSERVRVLTNSKENRPGKLTIASMRERVLVTS